MEKPKFQLFTDGSCPKNDGKHPGGWAFILRDETGTEVRRSGHADVTTNNRMEMTAVIEGLKAIPGTVVVELCSDSEYVIKGISQWLAGWKRDGWKTRDYRSRLQQDVKNVDLWKEIDRLTSTHQVTTAWTRGHVGHVENEWCDVAAGQAARGVVVE